MINALFNLIFLFHKTDLTLKEKDFIAKIIDKSKERIRNAKMKNDYINSMKQRRKTMNKKIGKMLLLLMKMKVNKITL